MLASIQASSSLGERQRAGNSSRAATGEESQGRDRLRASQRKKLVAGSNPGFDPASSAVAPTPAHCAPPAEQLLHPRALGSHQLLVLLCLNAERVRKVASY